MKDVRKWIPEDIPSTVGGSWIGETDIYGTLRQVLVEPSTPDTTYDVGFRDETGMFVYLKYDQKGILASENLEVILFPGVKQFIISNASNDEDFRVKLTYQK